MNKLVSINANSNIPKVKQIEEQLRALILSGKLPPDEKLPSMRLLGKQLGVSVGIAKQALNTLTIEGILRSDPKIGVFVSNKKPTKDIALVLPSVELEQVSRVVRGSRSNLPGDFRLVIEAATNDFSSQIDIIKTLNKSHIKGILLMTPPITRYTDRLKESLNNDIPCVQILFELETLTTDSVTFDGFEMGSLAMNLLLSKGHREIGLVDTDADATTFINRNEGMDAALRKVGKNFATLPKEIIRADQLNADAPSYFGQQAAIRLLKKHPELTAIIGGNGHISLGVIQAVRECGKIIPDDISVISFGADLSPFEHMTPSITAIDEPLEKICQRATHLLVDRINNPNRPLQSIHLAPVLRERESVRTII